ncbi:MAG: ATP-dependent helicase [Symploca sp. SIO1C4]|uniref:DNA 3'-5' helicase n=1 Tax=Symploca sp. SIO1C4 TaxID=2607765 RepID=A0A6B3NE16_9CYAN|nr:ATP-dependent helicase [Symploca sp. SIO1C4]
MDWAEMDAAEWRRKYLEFPWNDYQLNIFEKIRDGLEDHLMVGAVAGSGKTTLLRGIVAALPASKKTAILAFNSHIARELRDEDKRIPGRVTCCTAHAMGLSLLRGYFGGATPEVEDNKYYRLAQDSYQFLLRECSKYEADKLKMTEEELEKKYPIPPVKFPETSKEEKARLRAFFRFIKNICSFAHKTLSDIDPSSLEKIISYYDIDVPSSIEPRNLEDKGKKDNEEDSLASSIKADLDEFIELNRRVLYWGIRSAVWCLKKGNQVARENMVISYDEMLYLPYAWGLIPARKDYVLIDEVQDASPAQLDLYKKYASQGARLIMVGDPNQAIMGFAGADAYAWHRIKSELNAFEMPLSVCYRCPSKHISLAQTVVPEIKSAASASEGFLDTLDHNKLPTVAQSKDLIICRKTEPLISICLKMISQGVYARVRGRDLGRSLTALVRKACKQEAVFPNTFIEVLNCHCKSNIDSLMEEGKEQAAESLRDRWRAVKVCFKSFHEECSDLSEFCDRVEDLFSEDQNVSIALSTIHRAKGSEANRIFLVGSNYLPFLFRAKFGWQKQAEWNLLYVALTRAKKELIFVPYPTEKEPDVSNYLKHPLGGIKLPQTPPSLSSQEYRENKKEERQSQADEDLDEVEWSVAQAKTLEQVKNPESEKKNKSTCSIDSPIASESAAFI